MTGRTHTRTPGKPPATVFLAASFVVFFCALSAADSVGFVPYYIDGSAPLTTSGSSPAGESTHESSLQLSNLPELGDDVVQPARAGGTSGDIAPAPSGVYPVKIAIPAIDLDLTVQNPETRDIEALDELLKNGPARYVDSSKLGVGGNMVIFAHSSHLPIVHNKMFQAFNKIPNLKAGDSITLTGQDGKGYLYTVKSIQSAKVGDGTQIDLAPEGPALLTLVTCDTLTGKSARYVLTAEYVGVI